MSVRVLRPVLLVLCLAAPGSGFGGGELESPPLSDVEEARRAVGRGEFLSLSEIVARVVALYPGQVVEVELEDEDGLRVYEIEVLTETGLLLEVDVDPRTAEILSVETETETEDDDDDDDDDGDDDD